MEPEKNLLTPEDATAEEDLLDADNRKVGVPRFFELMGRDLWPIYKAGILCCLGFAPVFAAEVLGIILSFPLLCLVGGAVGGVIAAPFLCGLFDTILRALRDEPGYWWHTYRMAWKQNWREALLPGALFGLLGGVWCWLVSALPGMDNVPMAVWICLLVGVYLSVGYFCYVFAQVALVALPLKNVLKNAGLFFIGFLPRTLAAAIVQCVYWALILLYMPYTLPLTLVTGFWLPCVISLQILYPALEKAFHLEKKIKARRDAALGGDNGGNGQ